MKGTGVIAICLILLMGGCPSPSRPLRPGEDRFIAGVPFFPQEKYQCGPASLAGVLNFWGMSLSPADIAGEIFSPGAKGTLNTDMVFYAEKRGLNVKEYAGHFADLEKNIASGMPLIVMIDEGFWVYQQTHFMVVVGYNEAGIIANSGTKQHAYIPRDHFAKTWEKTKFWTLRIGPK